MVRAKFKVDHIVENVNGYNIVLYPVTSGSKENESFYKWTPSGKIELATVNKEAGKQFVPGQEYYVDFTPTNA